MSARAADTATSPTASAGANEVQPLRLAWSAQGNGEPVIIVHGFTGSAEAMAPLTQQLGAYRCVAVDLLGHGASPSPRDTAPYRVSAQAAMIAEQAALLADGPPHVIGYSLGGRIALTLAVAHPQVCRSLTLISTTAGIADPDQRAQRRIADATLADRISEIGVDRFIDEWIGLPMWNSLRRCLSPQQWQASIRLRRRSDPVGLANSLRAAGTGSMTALWDSLATLEVPTLVVCGALDAKFGAIGREMADLLPCSTLAVVPEAGHAVHLERPHECAEIISRHLTEH